MRRRLVAREPNTIVWKQTATNLALNMYGSGVGDERGLRIELTDMGKLTRLTLDYFYTELDSHLWLENEPPFPDSAMLTERFTNDMKAKGFKPRGEDSDGAAAPSVSAVVFVQPAADEAEEAAIRNRAAASVAAAAEDLLVTAPKEEPRSPLPPAMALKAPAPALAPAPASSDEKKEDSSWTKSAAASATSSDEKKGDSSWINSAAVRPAQAPAPAPTSSNAIEKKGDSSWIKSPAASDPKTMV